MECLALPCCGQQVVGTHWESDWLLAVATLKCYLGVGREAFCLGLQGWDGGEGRYGNRDIVDLTLTPSLTFCTQLMKDYR